MNRVPFAGLTRDNRLLLFALFTWGAGEGLFTYIQPLYLRQLGAEPVELSAVMAGVAVGDVC